MSLYNQPLLDLHAELIVDLFAGGGGASSGIEQALGRMVDIAINHDPIAVSLHQANHPQTRHMTSDVFEVDPREVTEGRPVGLLWASPDCTFHSKARGSKPFRSKETKRRALAWVVTRWAGQVRPRIIFLENVEEFAKWGPLVGPQDAQRPCKKRQGDSFRKWVKSLTALGYQVEWRELRACDYGAPTIRKRLYLIARCDGQAIAWPEPTHGPGRAKPYRTAAECIDWSIPMLSVFATKAEAKEWGVFHRKPSPIRPLADKTMARIARGVKRFVLDNPKPFLMTIAHGEGTGDKKRWGAGVSDLSEPTGTVTTKNHQCVVAPVIAGVGGRAGQSPERSGDQPFGTTTAKADAAIVAAHITKFRSGATGHGIAEPLHTITANAHDNAESNPGGCTPLGLVAAHLATYHDEQGSDARGANLDHPIHTIDTSNRHALVASFLSQNNDGFYEGPGRSMEEPNPTVCANGSSQSLIAAHIQRDFGTATGHKADQPLGTITTEGNGKSGLVASFLQKYYGTGESQTPDEPIHTIPTVDRFGLVTVDIAGQPYVIEDIAMRMLAPKELFLAQGFRPGFIIDRGHDGRPITKTAQVRLVGNSVSPPVAQALIQGNAAELVARKPKEMIA